MYIRSGGVAVKYSVFRIVQGQTSSTPDCQGHLKIGNPYGGTLSMLVFQLNIGHLDAGISCKLPESTFTDGQFHVRFSFQILGTKCQKYTSILAKGGFWISAPGVSRCHCAMLKF